MVTIRCIDKACEGELIECQLDFSIKVKTAKKKDEKFFFCTDCLRVFCLKNASLKRLRCVTCCDADSCSCDGKK